MLHFEGAFWTVYAGIILVFGIIQSCKPVIKYRVILQVKDWDIILILGLEMLDCHTKGLEMLKFHAFSSGKYLNVRANACVEYLTNIMSAWRIWVDQCLEKYDTVLLESCAICLWRMFNKICSADKVLKNQSQLSKYVRVLEIRMQIFLESYAIPALILGANWVSCWFWESILCRQSRVIHKVAQVTVVGPHVQHSIPCSGCRISLHITAICCWSKGEGEIVHISRHRGLVLSD